MSQFPECDPNLALAWRIMDEAEARKMNSVRVPITVVRPGRHEARPVPMETVTTDDVRVMKDRGWHHFEEIHDDDGLWSVEVPWMDVAANTLRQDGWTEDAPSFGRGEGGAGLELPSGAWILTADEDLRNLWMAR